MCAEIMKVTLTALGVRWLTTYQGWTVGCAGYATEQIDNMLQRASIVSRHAILNFGEIHWLRHLVLWQMARMRAWMILQSGRMKR